MLSNYGVLVCRGTKISTPRSPSTTEAAIVDRSASSEPEDDALPWHWFVIGLGAALVVISVVTIVGVCYIRKLRGDKATKASKIPQSKPLVRREVGHYRSMDRKRKAGDSYSSASTSSTTPGAVPVLRSREEFRVRIDTRQEMKLAKGKPKKQAPMKGKRAHRPI